MFVCEEEPVNTQCYCGTTDQESLECSLQCRKCKKLFHLECLLNGKPSSLEGDSFFDFTCSYCSANGIEETSRIKLQWNEVVMLALYNLQLKGGGKCGYFRWREHICNFIDKNWTTLFGFNKKKTTTWHGTVAGTLSAGCTKYFLSGIKTLKETGWWTLLKSRPPIRRDPETCNTNANRALRKAQASTKVTQKQASYDDQRPGTSSSNFTSTLTETPKPMSSASKAWYSQVLPSTSVEEVGAELFQDDIVLSDLDADDMEINPGSVSPASVASHSLDNLIPEMYDYVNRPKSVTSSSDSCTSNSDGEDDRFDENSEFAGGKMPVDNHMERPPSISYDAVEEASSSRESDDIPPPSEYCMLPLGIYEEKLLLNKLKQLDDAVQKSEKAKRLKRKLVLRQWKRDHGLQIFDLDDYVINDKKSCNYVARESVERILDRYQVGVSRTLEPRWRHTSFVTKLVGPGDNLIQPIVSPYTARILKPYIWQDFESKPLKLRLLEDIVAHYGKKAANWVPPPPAPINYCYVQPHHIPSVNALCKQFFWDGIDLSESLQYPDFSCIAQYRKVVIGFAFMVPDVKYNEAYISFIFTHPEWRNAGIASFMLYHLIQTCMGKDVTLHVSATSPAVLLYQKFGFKVEEFIVDFYDKYFYEENQECRHAMFLRLSR